MFYSMNLESCFLLIFKTAGSSFICKYDKIIPQQQTKTKPYALITLGGVG
jgi:hypothetical protein